MLLEDLIQGVNIEDYRTEFKGTIKEGNDGKGKKLEFGWLKELVAFANTDGGTLYIGVDNKTHQILALDHQTVDSMTRMIHRLVQAHVEPYLNYRIEAIAVPNTSPSRYIIALHVDKSEFPPVSLKINGIGAIYVRHFGETSIATNEELRYMILNSDQACFDEMTTNIKFSKEDFKILYDYYKNANDGKELTEKDLLNIGFMTTDGYLKNGSLLFKDSYIGEKTLIECSQFPTPNKGGDTFKASLEIKGNLLTCYQEALSFVGTHSSDGFVKTDTGRRNYVSYPKKALAEGIANAIGHRNYFLQSTQIEVNLYPDRLEIVSPGSLLGTRWLQNEKNLSSLPPMRRNKLICDILSLCRIMDHKGSGFDKIEEEYKPYGEIFAPFADSDGSMFCLTLPDVTYERGLVRDDTFPNVQAKEVLPGQHDLKILSYCYNYPKTAKEIADALGLKPSTYFRNNILKKLVDKGYLIENKNKYPSEFVTVRSKVYIQ